MREGNKSPPEVRARSRLRMSEDRRNDNRDRGCGDVRSKSTMRRERERDRSRSRDREQENIPRSKSRVRGDRREEEEDSSNVRSKSRVRGDRREPTKETRSIRTSPPRNWGKEITREENTKEKPKEPEHKPNFGLSGALAKDEKTGNIVNGIVLKFTEPHDASLPNQNWRLYVYKGKDLVETLHIHRRSCFLVGREPKVADILTQHESCSQQHAIIQYRAIDEQKIVDGERTVEKVVKPYLMDLKSTHGTFLNGKRVEDSRYYELKEGDLIKFGVSTRDYIILHDKSDQSA